MKSGSRVGAPPHARLGSEGSSAGRPIFAGVAPFARSISPRATDADLWAGLDALSVEPYGLDRLEKKHGRQLDGSARRRFSAYVAQAREYYSTLVGVDPVAKPLIAYYFGLNVTKAYLTAVDPLTTAPDYVGHGLRSAFERKQRYHFTHEAVTIGGSGVFRMLAERTGQGYCYARGHRLEIRKLLPYLVEGYDLYADAMDEAPRLLPIQRVFGLFGSNKGWLRVEVDRDVLRQRKISPTTLPTRARIFGTKFRLVETELRTASYESIKALPYGRRRSEIMNGLCKMFDETLIGCSRNVSASRQFVVLSEKSSLMSQEAVTFAVLLHLSNMVRYRPHDVEKLRSSRYFWLFSSWVDRACENFLLAMASRLTREEHVIA